VISGSVYSTNTTGNLFNNGSNNSAFNSNFNNLSKDFSAQYFITKNGNLTARYSYRLLNSTAFDFTQNLTSQYVNGLGLVYQRDFDTFGEFIRNIFSSRRRARLTPLPQPTTTPATGGTPPPTTGGSDNNNEKNDDND
jgi:hypothetical protein